MKFVASNFEGMNLPEMNRLYTFPVSPDQPPDDGFTILDSGAWGLYSQGKIMTVNYMHKLAEHYERFFGKRVYCIAPDVYLDPMQSMSYFAWWKEVYPSIPVCPVIQFNSDRKLDLFAVLSQCEVYGEQEFLFVSNPGLRATESKSIIEICRVLREETGAKWLHNLGAGWDPEDIRQWRDMGCFDSINSTAFYDDAKQGWRWQSDGSRTKSPLKWSELAHLNAYVADSIAGDYAGH